MHEMAAMVRTEERRKKFLQENDSDFECYPPLRCAASYSGHPPRFTYFSLGGGWRRKALTNGVHEEHGVNVLGRWSFLVAQSISLSPVDGLF